MKQHEVHQLIRESKIPEWTTILKELSTRQLSQHAVQSIKQLNTRLHAAGTLVDYARATVSRLVMRQIASETQAIIIKDVMSRRKDPMPQGSWVLDSIEGLEKKGVKLTKAEKAKLEKHLEALGIHDRELALFRLFRETARDIAHPDLEELPHDAINRTALDSLREADENSKLEAYGREVLETYWRTLRYFTAAATSKTRKHNKETVRGPQKRTDKIRREELRDEIAALPVPPFSEVVDSVYKLSKLDSTTVPAQGPAPAPAPAPAKHQDNKTQKRNKAQHKLQHKSKHKTQKNKKH